MDIIVNSKIALIEDKNISLNITIVFNSKNCEYVDVKYHHVLTNQKHSDIQQVLAGWSSKTNDDNKKWDELIRRIETCDLFLDWMEEDVAGNYNKSFVINEFSEMIEK